MTRYVLDASAVLRFLDGEPGHDVVLRVFREVRDGEAEAAISAVNWGEMVCVLFRRVGMRQDQLRGVYEVLDSLRRIPLVIAPADDKAAERAGALRAQFVLPYVDCFAAALAEDRTLVTADYDFKQLPGNVATTEYLPAKPSGKKR